MKMEEFLQSDEEHQVKEEVAVEEQTAEQDKEIELDVQKAVVESLAAEKVECDERISSLEGEKSQLCVENEQLKAKIAVLEAKIAEYEKEFSKVGDLLSANSETEGSNKVSLLDRDVDIADRFVGETREQVLEVIKEARNKAEADGRIRCAQVLEGVLVANESTGELASKRAALEKFFNDNGNILTFALILIFVRCNRFQYGI